MMDEVALDLLLFTNDTLTAATVIIATTMLLYNLARNRHDRVTRASAAVLGCVTVTYAADSVVGLEPDFSTLETWYRLQWIGIAFIPAAMFHLADALLATTGRLSRGRRRLMVRVLYAISAVFTLLAAFTDTIVTELASRPVTYMQAGSLFLVYTLYFAIVVGVAFRFVWRARERCRTTTTRRRMTFLLAVFLSPGLGIYPYSLLFDTFGDSGRLPLTPLLVVFNLANLLVVVMLLFLSYPLSFFGTDKPDRLVKADLLQFLLRGPFTAVVLLAAMVTVPRVTKIWGVLSEDFVIVISIGMLLFLQWSITLVLPLLENWFIYTRDQREASALRQVSERLLTRADTQQVAEAILAAACDYLRVPAAFLVGIDPDGSTPFVEVVGDLPDSQTSSVVYSLSQELPPGLAQQTDLYAWESFWIVPLRDTQDALLGILGIWARELPPRLNPDEREMLHILTTRITKVLTDLRLQTRLFELLDDLATEMEGMHQLRGISRYGHLQTNGKPDDLIDSVHGALRDLWGGPKLAESSLINLKVVQQEQQHQEGSPTRALQVVLTKAIKSLRPEGERSNTTTEWILYNILEQRFLQGKKVRDVTLQLSMSNADFYRKQRIAIEEVARRILEMERSQSTYEFDKP